MPCFCLFALVGSFAPRVGLLLAWLFTDVISRAFQGNWVLPLLGIVFLPFTTLMYVIVSWSYDYSSFGVFGWLFVFLGFLFDIGAYSSGAKGRQQQASQTA